ncbi:alpha-L-fucosidase [Bianquea renquensis]|uniref:alpha-L-fucosidase n=1 Tax=Bianquea renquensis TaxID=2763661 RepID=A0A926DTK2_9FIRM|nr:alpha-L-fucosidase [Bianquea renquensis]MBC8543537.1 alpha-L-fucosidase [Bianquea renquensis]
MEKNWFSQDRFGFMMHWGLYSLPAGEWKGQQCEYIGEWLQSRFRIPNAEYSRLAECFNPVLFDADSIVKHARDCGMRYLVLTSKHHEGFAMYRSEVDPYNIYDATPFKRDPILEFAEACYKYDLKLGLYYSQDLDWKDPDGGGYTADHTNVGGMSWTNDWDYPNNDGKEYARCFERKIKPQVKEILTRFGDLCLIWFDTPLTLSVAQSQELCHMVRMYQPNCLVNSRIGNGLGDYSSLGDNQIPAGRKSGGLFETAATLNDTWGYKSFDQNWKSSREMVTLLGRLASRNVNYLLNVGPDPLGRIPAKAWQIMDEVGRWMETCGEAIYGTKPSPFAGDLPSGPVTEGEDSLYFMLSEPARQRELAVNGIKSRVAKAELLGEGEVSFRQTILDGQGRSQVSIVIPESCPDLPVVKITMADGVQVDHQVVQQPEGSLVFPASASILEGNAKLGMGGDIEDWMDEGVCVTWPFTIFEAGWYEVEITCGSAYGQEWIGGHRLRFAAGDAQLEGELVYKRELDPLTKRNYRGAVGSIGRIYIEKPGEYTATLQAIALNPQASNGFLFRSVRLQSRGFELPSS